MAVELGHMKRSVAGHLPAVPEPETKPQPEPLSDLFEIRLGVYLEPRRKRRRIPLQQVVGELRAAGLSQPALSFMQEVEPGPVSLFVWSFSARLHSRLVVTCSYSG